MIKIKMKRHLQFIYGAILGILGGGLNMMAIAQNYGKMPVFGVSGYNKTHFGFTDFSQVAMPYLTDIIKVPGCKYMISVGDILIFVAIAVLFTVFLLVTKDFIVFYKSDKPQVKNYGEKFDKY